MKRIKFLSITVLLLLLLWTPSSYAQDNPAFGRFAGQVADSDPRVQLVLEGKKFFEDEINAGFPADQRTSIPENRIKVVSDFDKFRRDFVKKTGFQLTDANVEEMKATFMNNLNLQPPILVNVNSRAFLGLSKLAQKDPRGRQIAVAAIASVFRHEFLDHVLQKWTDEIKCHEDERAHFLQLVAGMDLGEYQVEASKYAQSLAATIAELQKKSRKLR